jgi:hypothetical protein
MKLRKEKIGVHTGAVFILFGLAGVAMDSGMCGNRLFSCFSQWDTQKTKNFLVTN